MKNKHASVMTVMLAAATLLATSFVGTASAAPTYSVSVGNGPSQSGSTVQTVIGTSAAAISGPAGLGVSAQSANGNGAAIARASVVFSDVIISGVGDVVSTSINLHLTGSLGASAGVNSAAGAALGVIGDWFDGGVNPCVSNEPARGDCGGLVNGVPAFPELNTTGILQSVVGSPAGLTIDGDFSSPVHSLPVNVSFTLSLTMVVVANAFQNSSSFADFFHTLTFSTDGPVFTLPDGYTVNSIDAGIVNNQFTTPVPLPGSLGAMGIAIVVLSAVRRRAS